MLIEESRRRTAPYKRGGESRPSTNISELRHTAANDDTQTKKESPGPIDEHSGTVSQAEVMMSKMLLARFEQLVRECAEKDRLLAEKQEELHELASERDEYRSSYNRSLDIERELRDDYNRIESALGNVRSDRDDYSRQFDQAQRTIADLKAKLPPPAPPADWEGIADKLVENDSLTPPNLAEGWTQPRWEQKLQRIKEFREKTGSGLKEGKEAIEAAAMRRLNRFNKPTLGDMVRSKFGEAVIGPKQPATECPDDCDCKGGPG
jgi:hypothetical protein